MIKIYSVILLFLAINVNADSTFKKPFPVCSNIQSYMAYEISAMVNERCDAKGVSIKIKYLHKYFNSLLSTNEASPFECSLTCLTIALTNEMSLKDCVNNLIVEPFVKEIIQHASFTRNECQEMKDIF